MSTKTTWSETINWLAFNVVAGLENNYFYCPIFGTKHDLPQPTNRVTGARNLRVFDYRGYSYFIKEVYNAQRAAYYYVFGLYVPSRTVVDRAALCNIVMVSKKMDHAVFFDTAGKIVEQTGKVGTCINNDAVTGL